MLSWFYLQKPTIRHSIPPGMCNHAIGASRWGWGLQNTKCRPEWSPGEGLSPLLAVSEKNSNCNPEKHTQNTRCKQNNHFLIFLKFSGRLTLIKSGTPNSRTLIRRNFWGLYLLESEPDWDSQVLQSESEWDSQVPRGALLNWTGTKIFFWFDFFYFLENLWFEFTDFCVRNNWIIDRIYRRNIFESKIFLEKLRSEFTDFSRLNWPN